MYGINQQEDDVKTITSKYPGRCRSCLGAILAGDRIHWQKGMGSQHVECPANPTPAPARPASDKQIILVKRLMKERLLDPAKTTWLEDRLEREALSMDAASKAIEALLAASPARGPVSTFPTPEVLPAGRYAIDGEDDETRFYRVWRGKRNPNIVKVYVSHGPNDSELPFPAIAAILDKIVAFGPREAAIRYGHEIGACCICGIRLTNHLSRELGIGPVCGGRFYDDPTDWSKVKRAATASLQMRGIDPKASVEDEVLA